MTHYKSKQKHGHLRCGHLQPPPGFAYSVGFSALTVRMLQSKWCGGPKSLLLFREIKKVTYGALDVMKAEHNQRVRSCLFR